MSLSASLPVAPPVVVRSTQASRRIVRWWLYGLGALVIVMVAIGGATRLTGSGLSITEWKPVTGAVPPLSDAAWQSEFDKYRASSQYQNLNRGMGMDEFRTIYWWEWSHRQIGRFIGLYFFFPLLAFWWTRAVTGRFALTLLGVGALGGLQATVGWIMVASGLQPGMTAVAPIKLTLHLLLASAILAAIVMLAAGLRGDEREAPSGAVHNRLGVVFLALVFLQIALGGLVAGSRAGLTFNTWPAMDGHLMPPADTLFAVRPWIENFVDNPALVQFNHRVMAYAVVLIALWQAWMWRGADLPAAGRRRAYALAGLAGGQMALGITTLLLAVPLWAGLAHQLLAMALLAVAAVHCRLTRGNAAGQVSPPIARRTLAG